MLPPCRWGMSPHKTNCDVRTLVSSPQTVVTAFMFCCEESFCCCKNSKPFCWKMTVLSGEKRVKWHWIKLLRLMTHCVQWLISSLIGFNDGFADFRLLCFPIHAGDQSEMMWAGGLQHSAGCLWDPSLEFNIFLRAASAAVTLVRGSWEGKESLDPSKLVLSFLDPIRTDLWMRGQRRPDSEMSADVLTEREREFVGMCSCLARSVTHVRMRRWWRCGRQRWMMAFRQFEGGAVMRCTVWGKFWSGRRGRRRRKSVFTNHSCHHKQLGNRVYLFSISMNSCIRACRKDRGSCDSSKYLFFSFSRGHLKAPVSSFTLLLSAKKQANKGSFEQNQVDLC